MATLMQNPELQSSRESLENSGSKRAGEKEEPHYKRLAVLVVSGLARTHFSGKKRHYWTRQTACETEPCQETSCGTWSKFGEHPKGGRKGTGRTSAVLDSA